MWLSAKSQLAAYTTKQTLQDFGSCFIHIKSSGLYINLEAAIFKKQNKTENGNYLTFLFFINLLQWFSIYSFWIKKYQHHWKLLRNAVFWGLYPRPTDSILWGLSSAGYILAYSQGGFGGTLRVEKQWGVSRGIKGVGNRVLFWPLPEGEHRVSLTIDGWLTWGMIIIYEGSLLSGGGFSGKALLTLWELVGRGGLHCGL